MDEKPMTTLDRGKLFLYVVIAAIIDTAIIVLIINFFAALK